MPVATVIPSTVRGPAAIQPRVRRARRAHPTVVMAVGSMTAVVVAGFVRLHVGYWNDEGISVGIASQPLIRIPGLLRQDSAPPAYYLLLHCWMSLFGRGPAGTHLLSLVAAVAAVPAVGWSAGRICGERAAVLAMALCAVDPFLWRYGDETRMYALVVLFAMAAATLFLDGLRRGGPGRLAGAVICGSLTTYLHDWGWFLVAALTLVGLASGLDRARRRQAQWSVAFGAGVGVLYLPWVPSLVYQLRHTGAPWSSAPGVGALVSGPARAVAGGAWLLLVSAMVVAAMIVLLAGRPADRPLLRLGAVVAVAVLASWVGATISAAWVERYLAILVGPFTVLAAGLLSTLWPPGSRSKTRAEAPHAQEVTTGHISLRWLVGSVATVAVVAVTAASALAGLLPTRDRSVVAKSNAVELAAQLRPYLRPGDVVLATDTSQLPVIAFYLGPTLRYGDPLGLTGVTYMTDWVDLETRLRRADPAALADKVAAALSPGQHLVVIGPPFGRPGSGYGGVVVSQAEQLATTASHNPQLVRVRAFAPPRTQNPLGVVVYFRR
jgi:mannosyltransferase